MMAQRLQATEAAVSALREGLEPPTPADQHAVRLAPHLRGALQRARGQRAPQRLPEGTKVGVSHGQPDAASGSGERESDSADVSSLDLAASIVEYLQHLEAQ